ncbi:MAG TPA: divalent-cation tolerance protein CutA [Candidatus Bathyarchaeota archaeon]|nr:divalent-cation tolerance protein CutA [Candidatus Bathyarchaeota archaeon]
MTSYYWWKGKIESGEENLILMETLKDKFEDIVKEVRNVHSYIIPEIIAISLTEETEIILNG